MSLEIINSGAQALVTDLGRPGHRHRGVPLSGAADRLSHQIANHILGNPLPAATIECALGGLSIRALENVTLTLCGADITPEVDGKSVPMWSAVTLRAGQTLSTSRPALGARTYLAVAGGIDGTSHFGSRATYPPARLGANAGRALAPGDTLQVGSLTGTPNPLPAAFRPRLSNHVTLRARSVSEWDRLSGEAQRRLFTRPWTASAQTSRMGARLDGDPLPLADARPMISGPLPLGTLQVTPSGQPILGLIDGHCTGGYARAIQVIAADVWLMGQIVPGTRISFNRCFADDAPAILDAHMALWGSVMEGYRV